MVALQILQKSRICMDWVDSHKINYKGLSGARVCMEFCNFCKVPIWTIFR